MQLSIVIVNYNVRYFLEQCLYSVEKAMQGLTAEVFVVDNRSADGSCAMVREKFPWVTLIENQENVGFSRANNQAIRQSSGKYVLLLNPDTLVEEDTFTRSLAFMEEHPEAGALGVRMIDGKGRFLPESKRGLPTPWVAFYKMFGLARLFPQSKKFGKYHLSYLSEHQTHPVDVLAGAFMLMRQAALDKAGLLDETFFMYGEDIDLSYRITQAGYKNYYFPGTRIIHYKGESTKKGSINYVRVFYNAMIIFAQKHFSSRHARWFAFFIQLAIYFRAGLSLGKRFLQSIFLPLADALLIWLGYFFFLPFWEQHHFGQSNYYPDYYLWVAVPAYIAVWLAAIAFTGGYRRPVHLNKHLKGWGMGTLFILVGYSLLSETYRFSRAMILIGSAWALVASFSFRLLLHTLPQTTWRLASNKRKRLIIVGRQAEVQRVRNLLMDIDLKFEYLGFIHPQPEKQPPKYEGFLGTIQQLEEILTFNKPDELIFCSSDLSAQQIIASMLKVTHQQVEFKIAPPETLSVIGSNSIHTAGELYVVDFNSIAKPENRRAKRVFDVVTSLAFLFTGPLLMWFYPRKRLWWQNVWQVLAGRTTWVGYASNPSADWPQLKPGILTPSQVHQDKRLSLKQLQQLDMTYAKNYQLRNDLWILAKGFSRLDHPPQSQ